MRKDAYITDKEGIISDLKRDSKFFECCGKYEFTEADAEKVIQLQATMTYSEAIEKCLEDIDKSLGYMV